MVGVSKANSVVDLAQLEYCIREDLQPKVPVVMAVLDPIKLVITNYPEGQTEMLEIENHPKNEEMGKREVPSQENFILRLLTLWKNLLRNTLDLLLVMK